MVWLEPAWRVENNAAFVRRLRLEDLETARLPALEVEEIIYALCIYYFDVLEKSAATSYKNPSLYALSICCSTNSVEFSNFYVLPVLSNVWGCVFD